MIGTVWRFLRIYGRFPRKSQQPCAFAGIQDGQNLTEETTYLTNSVKTRNQVAFTGSWVRIPPLPPSKNPVTMRVSGFFLFCVRSKNHPVLGCSFHNLGKNSFSLYSPIFSAFCSHLLPKSPASGRGISLTITCAEDNFEL